MGEGSNPTITIATFDNKQDNRPKCHQLSWNALAKRLLRHDERSEKDGKLWSPTTYVKDSFRCNAGITEITMAVGDFDNGTSLAEIRSRIKDYEYVIHTTFSSTEDWPKARVIIPFTKPIPRDQWQEAKRRIDEHVFGLKNDPGAKDASRMYYVPSCLPGAYRLAERNNGKFIDPDNLPKAQRRKKTAAPDGILEERTNLPLGKKALEFVANGAPVGEQRSQAVAAARNYLEKGYSIADTAQAIWRGFQVSPVGENDNPWTPDQADALVEDVASKPAPPLENPKQPAPLAPLPERSYEPDDDGVIFAPNGLGYSITFPEEEIRFIVDHLGRHSGTLSCELLVERTSGEKRHISSGSFNLSGMTARGSQARHLKSRAGVEMHPWENMVEVVCRRVTLAERTIEPVMKLGGAPCNMTTDWLIDDLVLADEPTTLFGEGGSGKSYLALAAALSIQTGYTILPGFTPKVRGNILYLDWETSRKTVHSRIQMICNGLGMESPDILYQYCSRPLADGIEEVLRTVQAENIIFIVVDSVERAMAGTRERGDDVSATINKLHNALRALSIGSLLVDHIAKSMMGNNTLRTPYNSIFKVNDVRLAFHLEGGEQDYDQTRHLKLTCTKRNDGPLLLPVGIRMEFPDGELGQSLQFFTEDVITGRNAVEKGKKEQILAALLHFGPRTIDELVTLTGLAKNTVKTYCQTRMKGELRILGNKDRAYIYGLPGQTLAEGPDESLF